MTPLAAVLQACIVGGALIGVLVLLGGTAVADYLAHRAAVAADRSDNWDEDVCGQCGKDFGGCQCADDPGAEWDRARDRWIDEQTEAA